MNDKIMKVFELIFDNLDLPVIFMVDGDVVCDDCLMLMASVRDCGVEEYTCYNERYYDDRDKFKEDYYDRNDDILCEKFGYDPRMDFVDAARRYKKEDIEANDAAGIKLNKYLDEVVDKAFRRAIIVYIGEPDKSLIEEVEDEHGEEHHPN